MTIFEKEHRLNKRCIRCGKLLNDRNTSGECTTCRLIYSNPSKNEINKLKISNSMKKAHKEGRAYTIGLQDRKINSYSRPEKWCSNVLKNNKIKNVKHEKRIGKYFIDFLINDIICLEMDGEQHTRNFQKLTDMEKDFYLQSNGYIVGRVSWKDCFYNSKNMVKLILNFIKTENNYKINNEYADFNKNVLKNEIYHFCDGKEISILDKEYLY